MLSGATGSKVTAYADQKLDPGSLAGEFDLADHVDADGTMDSLALQLRFDEESGLFLLTMHPHVIGHRSRMALLDELVRHIRGHDDVWFATHAEVARWCLEAAG